MLFPVVLCTFVLSALASPSTPLSEQKLGLRYPKQRGRNYDYTGFEPSQKKRADDIVEMFRFAWNGYYTHAFPHDSLRPKYNNYTDDRNGWGVTAVDGLDTAILMEQTDIVEIILDFIPTINFTKTNTPKPTSVSLFETNIRYLGGLLSAYDLLKGPFKHLKLDEDKVDALLKQATTLADTLKFAFDTPSGIPFGSLFIENQTSTDDPESIKNGTAYTGLAAMGTLVLEWQHLSDLTGDPQYGKLANRAEEYWLSPSSEVWPGLTGGRFSLKTGEILDNYGGWTSGNDSAYEYLIKMYVYDPDRFSHYGERFTLAADSTIKHLISHPSSRPDLTFPAAFTGTQQINYTEFLACFVGGSFILGSSALDRPDWLKYGLDFSEYCANGYRYAASGIGPTLFSWDLQELAEPTNRNQTAFYERAGFFLPDQYFIGGQSPESVESWYYAYQKTHDQYWRDVAWAYTLAQNRTMRINGGFASISNVLSPSGGGVRGGIMASFMLAEVLKYMWLIQTEDKGEWHILEGGKNLFVYNTEAHPLRVAAKNPV
ncbi:mannosyl-oligosaccharide alpha-1 2-mannosidase [Fusarium beomiforme]|uniref:alpha-1,2-Mannosidase n=1 Tax=Fusarium beomiforme TaxID=44412 RepID=A0A9P5DTP5_9HYPO|nr:mannosyl-oligosaccharide alpha-1 2-mannosidase [Fusarium beomiforme]